jgi:hypothetical protein
VGVVGGSDLLKVMEQLGKFGKIFTSCLFSLPVLCGNEVKICYQWFKGLSFLKN